MLSLCPKRLREKNVRSKINVPQPTFAPLALSRQSFTRRDGLLDMKIVPKIIAAGMAVSLNLPKPAPAVPIVIAPLVCAKACVLVGTTIVGGASSYIWHHQQTKKKYFADKKGNVRKMIDDPEKFEEEQIIGVISAQTIGSAKKQCKELARKRGLDYIDHIPKGGGKYACIAK